MSIRTAPACEPTMTWTAPPGSHGGSPRLAGQADTSRPAGESRVHASYWWITEDGTYLGAITLRRELNDVLLRAGGHIGYGIRPSARGRGLATWVSSCSLSTGACVTSSPSPAPPPGGDRAQAHSRRMTTRRVPGRYRHTMVRKLAAEFLGTAILVFFAV